MNPPLELIKAFALRGIPVTRALLTLRKAGYAIRTQTFLDIYRTLEKAVSIEDKIKYLRFDKIIPEDYFIPTSYIFSGRKYRIQGNIQVINLNTNQIEFRPFVITTNRKLTRGSIKQLGREVFSRMREFTNLELLDITTDSLYKYVEE